MKLTGTIILSTLGVLVLLGFLMSVSYEAKYKDASDKLEDCQDLVIKLKR